jgi:hypothetical protein
MTDAEAKRLYKNYIKNSRYTVYYAEWDNLPKGSKKVWSLLLDPANRRVNKT